MTSRFRQLLWIGMVLPACAHAEPFQNIDALENRVVAALGAGVGEPGGPAMPIDRRMKLEACPTSVVIDPPAMGAIALRCPQIGWRIRVRLAQLGGTPAAGQGYAASAAAPVIKRGDPVELYAGSNDFRVSTEAVAQEDGAIGSRIRVRTDPKNPNIIAQVVDSGVVQLAGFK